MDKKEVFRFLEELQKNNSKDWMDANRKWFEQTKSILFDIFDPILDELKTLDPRIVTQNTRKGLNRINNNLMFHPDRPTYKDHFGIGFGYGKGLADFYIHLGIDETLIAGGLWHPPVDKLKKLRSEIDYEGDQLMKVLDAPEFQRHFQLFQEDKLTNSPKGFDKNHEHIELLKMKSLGAWRHFDRQLFFTDSFSDLVIECYKTLVPMIDFINVAISND